MLLMDKKITLFKSHNTKCFVSSLSTIYSSLKQPLTRIMVAGFTYKYDSNGVCYIYEVVSNLLKIDQGPL